MIKIRKKVLLIYVVVAIIGILLGLFIAKTREKIVKENNVLDIVTTFYPVDLITRNLIDGIEGIKVTNITKQTNGCVHEYSLIPSDMKRMEKADLLIINGKGMEPFVSSLDLTKYNVVNSSKDVDDDASNHIWMNPDDYIKQVQTIADALVEKLDDGLVQIIRDNEEKYIESINETKAKLEECGDKNVNVAIMHDSLEYFEQMGIYTVKASLYSAHDGYVSANEIKNFIQAIKDNNIKVILIDEETYEENEDLINTINNEVDVKFYEIDLITADKESLNQYFEDMYKNIEILEEAVEYAK